MRILKLIFIKLLFTSNFLFSGVDLTTVDSWKIINAGPHVLLVNKFSENIISNNGFLFHMERPHCLCVTPTFVMYSPDDENFKRPKEDERIRAMLRVDFKKKTEVELEVYLALEERQQNILRLKGTFPSLRNAKIIELESVYGSDKWVIENMDHAMSQAQKICESFIPYEEEEIKDTKGKKV